MTKEYLTIAAGILIALVPLTLFVVVKAQNFLGARPDQKLVYKTVAGEKLALHAFYAAEPRSRPQEPRPALLLFHGGRWLYGGPEAFYPQCQYFAAKGYHCFSAQYRLGVNNQVDVRQLVDDAQDALNYLIENASELHVNPDRIAMGGGSSGGHLAAAIGVAVPAASTLSVQPRPAALILYNPMLDLAPGTPDYPLVADYWESVSPHNHVDTEVPPTIILVGSKDPEVPVPTAQAFCNSVSAAGGFCELAVYEGQGHGFFNHEPYLERTNARVHDFLLAIELQ